MIKCVVDTKSYFTYPSDPSPFVGFPSALGIEVPEDEVDKLVTMMQKVSKVDVNVDALKKQAGEIYNKLKDAGIELSNVDTKGLAQKIGDFFANIFEAIVRFFSGLFG